jgi:hypothetical protein
VIGKKTTCVPPRLPILTCDLRMRLIGRVLQQRCAVKSRARGGSASTNTSVIKPRRALEQVSSADLF